MKTSHLFLCLIFCATLRAAPVESHIAAVTVYIDRAIVTRTATVDLPAGQSELVFEKLPAGLLDQSLQVSGRGAAQATILDVNARITYVEATPNPRVKSLQDEIKNIQKQIRVIDDRAAVLEQQRDLLKRINVAATTPAPAGRDTVPAPRPGIDDWQKLLGFSDESLSKIQNEQQSLDVSRETLQNKINALESQLNELNGAQLERRSYKTVTVRVAAADAGSLDLTLAYAVPGASWAPTYDARLRSDERAVELTYFGVVRQSTGEDWKDVALTLSTARPSLGGGAPELEPWIVDVEQPRPAPLAVNEQRYAPKAMGGTLQAFNLVARDGASMDELKKETSADLLTAVVESDVTSASFKIPIAATILSDNAPQKVGIATAKLAARLQYQATPRALEAAFLSAYATNTTDYPLLAGAMNTFLNDAFIATSSLKTVMPGEKFELALGADEGIAIKRKLVNRFTENTGFTNSGRRVTYEFLVTLTNNKRTAEHVVFKDIVPISRNEKIEVKLINPSESDVGTLDKPREITREADGKLVWRLDLKPGEKREVPLKFSVEYPANITVAGLE